MTREEETSTVAPNAARQAGEQRSDAPIRVAGRLGHLRVERSDAELARGLRDAAPWAPVALYDAYASMVLSLLRRLIGRDADIDERDLLHDTFVDALASVRQLHDPGALRGWLRTIATRKAYRAIRTKRMRRWLLFWQPHRLVTWHAENADSDTLEAYNRTYRLLETMSPRLRVPFALRFIEGLALSEVATACECSLATVKRRIAKASELFSHMARHDPVLCEWLQRGGRWS